MYMVIVTDVYGDGQAVTINGENDEPQMFSSIEEIEKLKSEHSLMCCDWFAFDCETGQSQEMD